MKTLFISILFSIFLVSTSQGSWFENIFSKTVTSDQLVVRGNISYTINSKKPYSGNVEDAHENGQVSLTGKYEDGLKTGLFIEYYDNGQMKKSSDFFMGTEEGEVKEFHKNGNVKTTYKMIDGKISDGLFRAYDEEGYLEKLEFFKKQKSLDYYESNNLIVVETGENFNVAEFFDDDGNFKIVIVHDSKTQKPFSGEYIFINRLGSEKDFVGSMIYNFKAGKLDGKGSEFDDQNMRYYRGEFKDGMEHGFFEYSAFNELGIVDYRSTGQFYLNKKNGTWVIEEDGTKRQEIWNNGIEQK